MRFWIIACNLKKATLQLTYSSLIRSGNAAQIKQGEIDSIRATIAITNTKWVADIGSLSADDRFKVDVFVLQSSWECNLKSWRTNEK